MSDEGVLYVATGARHLAEAADNALAARPFLGSRPIAVVTDDADTARASQAFDLILDHSEPRRSYRDKIPPLLAPPYERILYLDSDARIVERIDGLFQLLGHHDVGAAQAPVRIPSGWQDPAIPSSFPEVNSGVLLLQRGPLSRDLVQRWLDRYDEIDQDWDQAALRSALWSLLGEGLRLATLPPEANLRTTKPWIAGKGAPVLVVHGRVPSEEWSPLLDFLNRDIQRFRTSEQWLAHRPGTTLLPKVAARRPDGPPESEDLALHLKAVDQRSPDRQDDRLEREDPIFVLGAGWRSGSTLLQRMLVTDRETMIWGEPHDRARVVQSLAEQWRPFTHSWPDSQHVEPPGRTQDLAEGRSPDLVPELEALRQAHRRFLDRLYGEPARRAGRPRWGVKEVRFDADHVAYLSWLFPGARFLLLVRDPFDAFESYRQRSPRHFDWPAPPVSGPEAFGRLWSRLATGFNRLARDSRCLLLRYESLEECPGKIAGHLGMKEIASPSSLGHEPDDASPHPMGKLGRMERVRLARATRRGRELLGY